MRYDAVVIGSGVSGLTAAIILAKEGRRACLCSQIFIRKERTSGFFFFKIVFKEFSEIEIIEN